MTTGRINQIADVLGARARALLPSSSLISRGRRHHRERGGAGKEWGVGRCARAAALWTDFVRVRPAEFVLLKSLGRSPGQERDQFAVQTRASRHWQSRKKSEKAKKGFWCLLLLLLLLLLRFVGYGARLQATRCVMFPLRTQRLSVERWSAGGGAVDRRQADTLGPAAHRSKKEPTFDLPRRPPLGAAAVLRAVRLAQCI